MFRTTVVVLVTIKITLVPLQKLEKKFMKHLATHNHAHVHKHTRVYLICVCFFMWLYVRTLRPWLFINPSWVDFYCALFHFYRYYYDFLLFLCEQDYLFFFSYSFYSIKLDVPVKLVVIVAATLQSCSKLSKLLTTQLCTHKNGFLHKQKKKKLLEQKVALHTSTHTHSRWKFCHEAK